MCRKIRCDGKSCKVLSFWVYLNKAYDVMLWLARHLGAKIYDTDLLGPKISLSLSKG